MAKNILYIAMICAFFTFAYTAYSEEGHDHSGHKNASKEKKHDMKHDHGAKTGGGKETAYIKRMSPAGYDVVLGRKNPLEELQPELVKDEKGKTVKVFKLTVDNSRFEIFPDKFIEGWGFNGLIPGPTIRVKEGDRIRIILENKTDTAHTIHVHGQKKPVTMDGVPYVGQKPVEKGESYTYEFTVVNPGTHWYHCHVDSAHHVDMGMYGAFIKKRT
jgi:FtsP/CotA-like multicopper oxidase with cupredoxin domain